MSIFRSASIQQLSHWHRFANSMSINYIQKDHWHLLGTLDQWDAIDNLVLRHINSKLLLFPNPRLLQRMFGCGRTRLTRMHPASFNWKSARARWRALTMKMSPWLWRPCSCRIFWWVWRWQPELICLIISYTRYLDYVYTLHFESQLSWWFLGSAATTMPWVTAPKQSTIVRLSNVLKKIVPVATGSTATAAICSRTPVGPRIRLNSRKWVKVFFAWGQSRFSTFTKDFGKT